MKEVFVSPSSATLPRHLRLDVDVISPKHKWICLHPSLVWTEMVECTISGLPAMVLSQALGTKLSLTRFQ